MRDVCSQGASWQGFGQGPISVGVNLSPKQFRDPDLVAEISASLEASGLSPENLALEIAEATWMEDIEGSIAIAKSLRALNVSLGMDNFGTAYSALAELQRLPLDMIKIDRSVVRGLLENEESHARITDLIAMGKAMGVSIVAEGVESQAQSSILSQLGCDQLQGYYFGKACHHRELSRLLREGVFTPKVQE
jgi:EAL domain-containing protein (putative c-di-GMP-specific phosphodiesterase class I)